MAHTPHQIAVSTRSGRVTGYPDRTRKWSNVRMADKNEAAGAAVAAAVADE
jgi:hypothetical protein